LQAIGLSKIACKQLLPKLVFPNERLNDAYRTQVSGSLLAGDLDNPNRLQASSYKNIPSQSPHEPHSPRSSPSPSVWLARLRSTPSRPPHPPPLRSVGGTRAPRARARTTRSVARIAGKSRHIVYGRPYSKDPKDRRDPQNLGHPRPYDKVWRTGADEATLLITQRSLRFQRARRSPPALTLSIPCRPRDGSAQLLFNKQIGQWGADPYDQTQEFARVPLTKEPLRRTPRPVAMAIEKNPAGAVSSG